MTAYLRRSTLSAGGLALVVRNDQGQLQDPQFVLWTVSSAHDGRQVSGYRMRAARRGVGQYYAPWWADDPTGAYEIAWEYQHGPGFPVEKAVERFFVMDLDDPTRGKHVKGLPPPGGRVFEPGTRVAGGDMTLRLTGATGCPADASQVTWSIECELGRILVPDQPATRLGIGLYGVNWYVNVCGGQFRVRWKWLEFPDGPRCEGVDTFQVVSPVDPHRGTKPVGISFDDPSPPARVHPGSR